MSARSSYLPHSTSHSGQKQEQELGQYHSSAELLRCGHTSHPQERTLIHKPAIWTTGPHRMPEFSWREDAVVEVRVHSIRLPYCFWLPSIHCLVGTARRDCQLIFDFGCVFLLFLTSTCCVMLIGIAINHEPCTYVACITHSEREIPELEVLQVFVNKHTPFLFSFKPQSRFFARRNVVECTAVGNCSEVSCQKVNFCEAIYQSTDLRKDSFSSFFVFLLFLHSPRKCPRETHDTQSNNSKKRRELSSKRARGQGAQQRATDHRPSTMHETFSLSN